MTSSAPQPTVPYMHTVHFRTLQYLVIVPASRIVAVRMRTPRESDCQGRGEVPGYRQFTNHVLDL